MTRFARNVAGILGVAACLWVAVAVGQNDNDARVLLDWKVGAGVAAIMAWTWASRAWWRARER